MDQRRGDVLAFAIGHDGDAFVRLDVEADANRIPRTRGKFLVESRQHTVSEV